MTGRIAIQTFSATKHEERNRLGESVTRWISDNPRINIQDIRVLQSSDSEFHCLTIVVIGDVV